MKKPKGYVMPGNRSNGSIKSWKHQLYVMPQSDKTGILSRVTQRANAVLSKVSFRYHIGLRVSGSIPKTRFHRLVISGVIIGAEYNLGLIEYRIQSDDGNRYWLAEKDIDSVLSLVAEVA